MDIRKIKKLIELMEESDLSELEVREGDDSIRIARGGPQVVTMPAATPQAASAAEPQAAAPSAKEPRGTVVRAGIVGTFYRAPSPNSPPFVEVDQRVRKGDVLCIIESMKMMNEIQAEMDGVIEAILVGNGEPVEYDQPMFTII